MSLPWVVLIDLQFDFYHPAGIYARAGRPIFPFQSALSYLCRKLLGYPKILRIASNYDPHRWTDMPGLCSTPVGSIWYPHLAAGKKLIKQQQTGYFVLKQFFTEPRPLLLAGFCTHRCVNATLHDLLENNWPVKLLPQGVAACGKRQDEHASCLHSWARRGLLEETLF